MTRNLGSRLRLRRPIGWLRRHRDALLIGIIVTVVGGLFLAAILGVFDGSEESKPRIEQPGTQAEARPARERDPATGERPIAEESSAEFFDGDLTVSIGAIRRVRGELEVSHVVIRAIGAERCAVSGLGNGEGVGADTPNGEYRVEFRALKENQAAVVAFRSRVSTLRAATGCFLAFPLFP